MIGWLKGQIAEPWQHGHRCGVLLICHGVGYEVLLSTRHWRELPPTGSDLTVHVHHTVRDDAWMLYGFPARPERDLFRELVAVSGIGPQMALALLGALPMEDLIRAIVHGDLRLLTQAPGVGKRTAERLSVELRQRLHQRFLGLVDAGALADLDLPGAASVATEPPGGDHREDVQITLTALGYEPLEIHRALRAVAAGRDSEAGLPGEISADEWIRDCLRWLSRPAA
jgi:Holliday junction DNA helicase RuvA